MNKLKIGVSRCILKSGSGYNYITFFLKKWFELVPICPDKCCNYLSSNEEDFDITNSFSEWFQNKKNILLVESIVAYISKSGSYYCDINGNFVKRVKQLRPDIPIETDLGINNPLNRDRFITSLFILKRWRELDKHLESIVLFHNSHKYLLFSFNESLYYKLDRVILKSKGKFYSDVKESYFFLLIEILQNSRKRSTIYKVLLKLYTEIEIKLNSDDRYELHHLIKQYKKDRIPLIEPVTLINHYVKSFDMYDLKDQYFINPTTVELNLLYHA